MRKGLEAALAVVAAHAAFANAPKGHLAGGQMDHDVVDAAAAELEFLGVALDVPLVA